MSIEDDSLLCFCGSPVYRGPDGTQKRYSCKRCMNLWTRYGTNSLEVDWMYFLQGGKCAIRTCNNEAVHMDHCHTSTSIRELLCHGCNVKLGAIENEMFPYLLEYIYKHNHL